MSGQLFSATSSGRFFTFIVGQQIQQLSKPLLDLFYTAV
jgi:hypothetical protein